MARTLSSHEMCKMGKDPLCEAEEVHRSGSHATCRADGLPDCGAELGHSSHIPPAVSIAPVRPPCISPRLEKFRTLLRWSAFSLPVAFEVCFHALNGMSKEAFKREAYCKMRPCSQWHAFVKFAELLCRVCLALMLTGTLWDLCRAALHCDVRACVRRSCGSRCSRAVLGAALLPAFTFAVGTWGVIVRDDLPEWAAVYSHVADIFCHAIIASAIMGFTFDFALAVRQGWLGCFLRQLLTCMDTIEAHGVTSSYGDSDLDGLARLSFVHRDREQEERHRHFWPIMKWMRLAIMWAVFLLTLSVYVLCKYLRWHLPWLNSAIDFLGSSCWSGIAWWLVVSMDRGRGYLWSRIWVGRQRAAVVSGGSAAAAPPPPGQ